MRIPEQEIIKLMTKLDLTREEAIQVYLEDEGIEINEEVERLTAKAKANKTDKIIGKRESETPKKRTRERKANPIKEEIIKLLENALKNYENLQISNVKIENVGKIITFKANNKDFKLDLIEKRVKK